MIETHGRVCVFCGGPIRVGRFDRAVWTVASSSGQRTWQVVTVGSREIHCCAHAGAVSVQNPRQTS
jgi:hypothetical protein